jgi:hypothetical protein
MNKLFKLMAVLALLVTVAVGNTGCTIVERQVFVATGADGRLYEVPAPDHPWPSEFWKGSGGNVAYTRPVVVYEEPVVVYEPSTVVYVPRPMVNNSYHNDGRYVREERHERELRERRESHVQRQRVALKPARYVVVRQRPSSGVVVPRAPSSREVRNLLPR